MREGLERLGDLFWRASYKVFDKEYSRRGDQVTINYGKVPGLEIGPDY